MLRIFATQGSHQVKKIPPTIVSNFSTKCSQNQLQDYMREPVIFQADCSITFQIEKTLAWGFFFSLLDSQFSKFQYLQMNLGVRAAARFSDVTEFLQQSMFALISVYVYFCKSNEQFSQKDLSASQSQVSICNWSVITEKNIIAFYLFHLLSARSS